MNIYRIFLASSNELEEDRDQFHLFISKLNALFIRDNIYLEVVRWEHFFEAVSPSRKQNDYNEDLVACDIVLCLFFTKVGKYTEEEFDTAYKQFQDTGKPYIWTYFKDANISTGSITKEINTLLNFKEKLKSIGHFHGNYKSVEHLESEFRTQIDFFLKKCHKPPESKQPVPGAKKFISPEIKYLCDRIPQATAFHDSWRKNKEKQIHFFVTYGHEFDGHQMFVNRCKFPIRKLTGNNPTLDILFNGESKPPSGADKVYHDLCAKVIQKLNDKIHDDIDACTVPDILECLHRENKNCLVVSIQLQSTSLIHHLDTYIKGFRKFYDQFTQSVDKNPAHAEKRIIFFIQIFFIDEAENETEVKDAFTNEPGFKEISLPRFDKIDDSIISEWIKDNIEDSQIAVKRYLTRFFSDISKDSTGMYYMEEAETPMQKAIDYYNDQSNNK